LKPDHQGNANQNYTEMPSQPQQKSYYQGSKQQQMQSKTGVLAGKEPITLLVGM
jgi:hypothetical protein